jgi:hypothetical protein
VSEHEVPGKIFWPKKDEVGEQFRISHNEILHDLYSDLILCSDIQEAALGWCD